MCVSEKTTMRVAPFILDESVPTAHQYYSPRHYKNLNTFNVNPGDSLLVSLSPHDSLDQVTSRLVNYKTTVTSRYKHQDMLGLLVTYKVDWSTGKVINVPINTSLNQLLELPFVKSRFVLITAHGKMIKLPTKNEMIAMKKRKKKNMMKTNKKCGCCCYSATTKPTVITSISSYSSMQKSSQQKKKEEEDEEEEEEESCTDTCDHSDVDDDVHVITLS